MSIDGIRDALRGGMLDVALTGKVGWFAQGPAETTLPRLADLVERDLAGARS